MRLACTERSTPPRASSRATRGISFWRFFDVLRSFCVIIRAGVPQTGLRTSLLPVVIACQWRNRDNVFNSEELRGNLVPFRFDEVPHIVQISARRCFSDGIYREERANFVGSTLFVLKSVTSSVAGLFFSTKAP